MPGRHPHEAAATMTVPLLLLAALSVVGGFIGVPESLGGANRFEHWLEPVFERASLTMMTATQGSESEEYLLMVLSVAVAAAGIWLALRWYLKRSDIPEKLSRRLKGLYSLLLNKYYVDEIYDAAVVTPTVKGSEKLLWRIVDVGIIDWLVNATARLIGVVGNGLRRTQSGMAQGYALIFVVGVIAIIGWLLTKL